jgi:small subunit ribosomal protein S8
MARHPRVEMPSSKMKIEIARILKEEGYLANFKVVEEKGKKTLRVFLRYTPDRQSVITDLKRISRPGSRRYIGKTGIRPVVGGMGISILSTPRGLMTGQSARKEGVGGELLCEVW